MAPVGILHQVHVELLHFNFLALRLNKYIEGGGGGLFSFLDRGDRFGNELLLIHI